jgi:phage terminase small subunit
MPAKKPTDLINRHETAEETAQRAQRDASMRPKGALPTAAPAALKAHAAAQAIWRRMMRVYGELDAEIVTRMDQDLLVDYCILGEQVMELDQMRQAAYNTWKTMNDALDDLPEEMAAEERIERMAKVNSAMNDCVKLDGRVDRKRTLLLQWRQSLYMTPRARAGTAPKTREPEEPKDALETLLDDVTSYMNGGQ